MHRGGRVRATGVRDEVLPHLLGQERGHRAHDAQALHERVVQRGEGHAVAVPEARSRAAHVPVREVVPEGLDGPGHAGRVVGVERGAAVAGELAGARDHPAIERVVALGAAVGLLPERAEALRVGVEDEEAVRVPERQQAAGDVAGRAVAEVHVLPGILAGEHPAADVGSDLLDRVVEPDRVAPGLVHRPAVLVVELLVAEHALVGSAPDERHRHEQLGVEPEADLLAHLRDPVGREPLLPVGVVGQVGLRQPHARAGREALGLVGVAAVAERRERDDAGVEPAVAHLGHAHGLGPALGAGDRDGIDPWPVQLLQPLEARGGSLAQFLARGDDVHVPVRAEPERQRQAPVALARDAPVAHVAQPVLHALAEVRGRPLDRVVGVDHRLADLVAADEPLVDDAEDQLRPAAPAVRIAVLVGLLAQEPAAALEVLDDEVGHLVRAVARELAVALDEEPRFVDGHEHGQLLALADLEVLGAAARRDVDDPRALVHGDVGIADHPVGDLGLRRQVVEAGDVGASDQLSAAHAADDARVGPEDRAAAIPGHDVALSADVHPDVLGVGPDRRCDIGRQRPRRRRPDDQRLAGDVREAEAHVQRGVDDVAVGIRRCDFVL